MSDFLQNEQFLSMFLCAFPSSYVDIILDTLQDQTRAIKTLYRLMVGLHSPVPESTASQRILNQEAFKNSLIRRYNHCAHATNKYLKCMVLDHFFLANRVTASHIIGFTNHQSHSLVGMNYCMDRYHERNGLLLHHEIDVTYGNQLIVSFLTLYMT